MAENGTATGPNGVGKENRPESDKISRASPPKGTPGYGMRPAVLPMCSDKPDENGQFGQFQWRIDIPDAPSASEDTTKWAIVVRHIRTWGDSEKTLFHSIIIQSPLLKELLGQILKGYPDVAVNMVRLVFTGRCEPLIHRWVALEQAMISMDMQLQEGTGDTQLVDRIKHTQLLLKVLRTEFQGLDRSISDYLSNGTITFEHLWTIFEPGTLLYARIDNQNRALHLQSSNYATVNKQEVFVLTCSYVDFDGHRFAAVKLSPFVKDFTGTTQIVRLPAFPLELHGDRQNIRAQLIERGHRFESLAGVHFCHYDGVAFCYDRNGSKEHFVVNGRVVIDKLGDNQMNPNQAEYFFPSKDFDPADFTQNSRKPMHADDEDDASGMAIHGVGCGIPEHGRTPSGDDQKRPKLTENQKIICGPFVCGYALNEKKWLNLCINSLSDISFDELAFSDLRLPEQRKDLLVGLASPQQSYWNDSKDLIERKGRGVLIHLCGPHGVGKTLTAESVAEKLKVPLFTLASGDGDLELYSPDIESRLQGLMSMCGRWGAIILLDEADALLEETGRHNLDHKRLVSVFLRVTEHYKGIIFLTTNHVEKLNPAFESRIHISLEYPELDRKCRRGIWQTLLRRHNVTQDAARKISAPTVAEVPKCATKRPLSPAPSANPNGNQAAERLHQELTRPHQVSNGEIGKLAELKLNGRQIKKFLRTAQLMAIYKEEALQYGHINTAVSVLQQFHKAKEAQDEVYRRAYC